MTIAAIAQSAHRTQTQAMLVGGSVAFKEDDKARRAWEPRRSEGTLPASIGIDDIPSGFEFTISNSKNYAPKKGVNFGPYMQPTLPKPRFSLVPTLGFDLVWVLREPSQAH
jgi:hypothetical protein